MKKSLMYSIAQLSVVRDNKLDEGMKLDVIKMLQDKEELEKFVEKQAEEEGETNG